MPIQSNLRDERGWVIPRPNTKSREVYELMVQGLSASEIASLKNWERANVSVICSQIKHPRVRVQSEGTNPRPPRPPRSPQQRGMLTPRQRYVRKLVNVLGMPLHLAEQEADKYYTQAKLSG